jgi:hypothetical protein
MLFCLPLFICNQYPKFNTSIIGYFYPLIFAFAILLIAVGSLVAWVRMIVNIVRRRKQNVFAISINVIFLVMLLNYFVYNTILLRSLPTGSNLMKFDSSVWNTENAQVGKDGIGIREKMLKDLVVNVLPGKTKTEIEELLGTSLETNYFKSMDKDFIYYMGPQRDSAIPIDSEWLLIWLDDNNKFKKYEIVND